MDEPVRGVNQIEINLWPDAKVETEPRQSECIGAVIEVKPVRKLVVAMAPSVFDQVWMMALTGHLTHAACTFTEPRYRSALVTHLSLSNKPESDD